MPVPNFLQNIMRFATNEVNLVPVARVQDYHPEYNNVPRPLLPFPLNRNCSHVYWSSEDADVRVTFDGSDPVAGANGHFIAQNRNGTWSAAMATAARVVADVPALAHWHITQLRRG